MAKSAFLINLPEYKHFDLVNIATHEGSEIKKLGTVQRGHTITESGLVNLTKLCLGFDTS